MGLRLARCSNMRSIKELLINYRGVIWPILIGVSDLLIIFLIIIPQVFQYFQSRIEYERSQNLLQRLEVKAEELQNLDNSSYKEYLKLVFAALPQERDIPEGMVTLQNIISRTGLSIEGTRVLLTGTSEKKSGFQISITVFGNAQNLSDLLINLSNSARIFRVESINAQSIKSGIQAEILISTFYEQTPSTIGALEQSIPNLNEQDREILNRLAKTPLLPEATSSSSVQ